LTLQVKIVCGVQVTVTFLIESFI